jgi:hypothetical protein
MKTYHSTAQGLRMNQVVIIFVPTGAPQRDFEAALRERIGSVQLGETPPQSKADLVKITDNDQMPLWTWFIPNTCFP